MQKQLNKTNLFTKLKSGVYKPAARLLTMLLIIASSTSAWAKPGGGAGEAGYPCALVSTITASPSSLFFSAVEGQPSAGKQIQIVINGVSATAVTTITAPDVYSIISSTGAPIKTFSFTGNGAVNLFVRFDGGAPGDTFDRLLFIQGAEINTVTVSLTTAVSPNPSFFPSALNFSTINDGKPSLPLELDITISGLSSTDQAAVTAPAFYELLTSPTATPANTLIVTGSGVFKIFVRFAGSLHPGTFSDEIGVTFFVRGSFKAVPVKTVVTATPTPVANPAALSGFTAVQNVSASAVQSFDLSVKGLPVQGNPFVTVTAPKGYSVALSANASSFVSAFVVSAGNGNISTKVFARLNSNNPVGPVNGAITITGSQVNPKNVPLTGIINAKPLPTLTVDKTSLTGFTTTTNKVSTVQSYTLQATNLDPGVTATVKAPAGYEVSLANVVNSSFSQLTVNQAAAGTIKATIFVRLKSQATAGTFTGSVQNLVAGLVKNVAVSGTVALPPSLSVNPTGITGFLTVANQASAPKTYTVIAANLGTGVSATVTAPNNYEIRPQGTGAFVTTLILAQTSVGTISRIVEVRLKATATTGTLTGAIQNTAAGLTKTVGLTGVVAAPTLSTSTTSLTFTAVKNQASAVKPYSVIATNLASGTIVTITASGAYEISKDSIVFGSSLTFSINVTNGINTKAFVRLKATATTGTITGSINNTVAGLSKVITLSTIVLAPTLSANPVSLTGFVTKANVASPAKTYNLVAANLANGVTAIATAPAGYELSVQGTTTFSASLTLTQTASGVINRIILVRLKAQAATGSFAGNITNSVAGLSKPVAVNGTVTAALSIADNNEALFQKFGENSLREKALLIHTFPNPVTSRLIVEFLADGDDPVQIRLLDPQGKVLLMREAGPSRGFNEIEFSLAKQSSGTYFVEVISGTKHKTVQIIKQ